MRITRRLKKILPVFLLILQIFFSFAPLTTLIPTARAQEADPQPIQIDSQLKLDNYSGDFAVYYVVDGEIVAHQGSSEDNLELLLASISNEDVIKHQPERLVLKTIDQNFYLLAGEVDQSYQDENLELSDDDQDFLYNNWQVDGKEATTTWTVREGVTYKFPLNEQVQLRFNDLPSETSTLTIEEVLLSEDLQLALGAVSEIAYDVQTEMENGEFSYDLYLPKNSEDQELEIKYAQDLAELEQEAQVVEAEVSISDEQVKVANLDHMTVFVVVSPLPGGIAEGEACIVGETSGDECYLSIQAAIDNASDGDIIMVGEGTYTEAVSINVPNLTLKSIEGCDKTFIDNPNVGSETQGIGVLANMGVVTVDGFTVQNFRNGIAQGMAAAEGTAFIVKNNKIIPENNDTNPYLRNGIQVTGEGSEVIGNYVVGAPLTSAWSSSGIGVVNAKNVLVEGNTVNTGGADIGISILNYSAGLVENIEVIDNAIIGAGNGIRVHSSTQDKRIKNVEIIDNYLDNNGRGVNVQIVTLEDMEISNNDVLNNIGQGIRFSYSATLSGLIQVNNNSIHGNATHRVINSSTYIIDATSNWWGDNSGPHDEWDDGSKPNLNENASGDSVQGLVDYRNWVGSETFEINVEVNETEVNGNYYIQSEIDRYLDFSITSDSPIYGQIIKAGLWNYDPGTGSRTNPRYIGWIDYDADGVIVNENISWEMVSTNWIGNNAPGTQINDGEYLLWVERHWDGGGYINGSTITKKVVLDNTAPIVEITSVNTGEFYNGSVDFRGTGIDANPESYRLLLRYMSDDGSKPTVFNSGWVSIDNSFTDESLYLWDSTTSRFDDGVYRVRLDVRDKAGNWKHDLKDIKIDNTAPQGSIDSIYYSGPNKSKDYFITNDNKPVFEGTCSDNNGLQEVTLEVSRQVQTINCETDNTWRSAPLSSALTDGDYLVTLTLTDLAGNVTNKTQELRIDTTTPNAVHTYYKNGEVILGGSEVYAQSTGQLTFTGEYTDANPSSGLYWDSFVIFEAQDDGSFRFSANGKKSYCPWRKQPNLVNLSGSNFSLTDQISFANCETDLEDGVYYLTHQIYDSATRKDIPSINQFRDVLGLKFNIDATAPISTITNPDGDTYHSGPILIEGNTSDSNGVVSVKLSSAPYENESCGEYTEITTLNLDPALTSYDWTHDWDPSTEGQYCIKAQGTDLAGNLEQTSVVKNVIYDKTIPEVDLTVNPADPDGSGNWYITRPEVTLTANDNFEVDYIQYRWGTTGSWSTYSAPLQSPAEGTNTLYYKAFDKAGNESEEGIRTLQWDQTELTEGPLNIKADPNPTAESTSTISWDHASDNIGITKYKITWDLRDGDDKHSKEVAGDVTETEIDELKEGSYKITVTAYDGSGYNKSATTNLTVDRTAPIAPVLTLLAQRPGEIDLSWEAIEDADRYIIYYGLEAGNYLYAADVGNVIDYTVTGLTAGNYYFIVRAVDESDNQSANSNEVSILDLAGAPAGTVVAEGFAEAGEVQGETTEASEEEQAAMNEEIAKQGEVKGAAIACTGFSKSLFWLFLAMQAAAILLLAKFSKQGWLKLLAFLALPAVFTVIIMRTGLANCFGNETMIWLTNNYYLPAYLTAMLTKMLELFFIAE